MRAILGMGWVLALACGAAADDKKDEKVDAKLLVGKWASTGKKAEPKTLVEYTADGKLTGSVAVGTTELKAEGTYKVEGNKLTQTVKFTGSDKSQVVVITLKKLTADEMIGVRAGGDEEKFVRVKPAKDEKK